MVLLKMLMEIAFPKMGELLAMMTMIFPFGGKFPWRNRSAGGQKCSCPSSASRRRRSVPKVLSLFFSSQNDLYTRRWAPEVGLGEHNPPGCVQVGLLWYLFAPIFFIYSIKILRE